MNTQHSHNEKQETLNKLLYLILVETHTPLTAVKGYVQLLLDQRNSNLTEEQHEYLQIVSYHVESIVKMRQDVFNQWTEYHKQEQGNRE